MLTVSNGHMVTNKKGSKIYKISLFNVVLSLKFVGTFFADSIISCHVSTKSVIILFRYLLFSQAHVLGLQI